MNSDRLTCYYHDGDLQNLIHWTLASQRFGTLPCIDALFIRERDVELPGAHLRTPAEALQRGRSSGYP